MKLTRRLAVTAAAWVVAGMAVVAPAAAQQMKAWNIHPEGYPNTVALDKFAELVDEKSGGRMTVQNFHGGVLGSQPDAVEQVRLGGIEIGNFNLGPIGPVVPAANVAVDDAAIRLHTEPAGFTAEFTLTGYHIPGAAILATTGAGTRVRLHGRDGHIVLHKAA